ncbi:MAG: substrate-binding domain-containing protein [Candidatus Thiodiazotropha sp.]
MITNYRAYAVGLLLCISSSANSVDLVINRDIDYQSLSRNALRSIFSMRMTQWPNGTPIRVFVMGDKTSQHSSFSKHVLGVFPHQLRRAWNRQIYSGTGQAPMKVETEAEMLEKIENTPGAIGYLSKDNINERVRKLSVE